MHQKPQQYVYFMRPVGMLGPVKIGCSVEPATRVDAYNRISPFRLELVATVPGDCSVEFRFHTLFADDWSHHEWFRHSPAIQTALDDLVAGRFDLNALPDINRPWTVRDRHWSEETRRRLRAANALQKLRWSGVKIPKALEAVNPRTVEGASAIWTFAASQGLSPKNREDQAYLREAA